MSITKIKMEVDNGEEDIVDDLFYAGIRYAIQY
jgi:hypothetical protein